MQKVIVITGPTATGKTALGVRLALRFSGEVVSADSMQIYEDMDIGTAKPSHVEMRGIPHHLISTVSPFTHYSAAQFSKDAAEAVDLIDRRGKLPFVVGGTGLYIDSLLTGRTFLSGDPYLRTTLELRYDEIGAARFHEIVSRWDSESAAKLHPNDKKRLVRALETRLVTGKTISLHNGESKNLPLRYDALKIALTFSCRELLYERINKRVDKMISDGLVAETESLIRRGLTLSHTAMQAIGYKEIAEALDGSLTLADAIELIKLRSRRYAKRQLTWFSRKPDVHWIFADGTADADGVYRKAEELTADFLGIKLQ